MSGKWLRRVARVSGALLFVLCVWPVPSACGPVGPSVQQQVSGLLPVPGCVLFHHMDTQLLYSHVWGQRLLPPLAAGSTGGTHLSEALCPLVLSLYPEVGRLFKSLDLTVRLQLTNSMVIGASVCPPSVRKHRWGINQACRKRKREPSYPAILTDCVNSVINGMRKQEECLSFEKKKEPSGLLGFIFN